jgi:hypothetical protein
MAVEPNEEHAPTTPRDAPGKLPGSDPDAFTKRFPRGTPFTRLMDRQTAQRRAASRDTEPPRR